MYARLSTWWTILSISLQERFVYRGDFALGTLMRFLPIVTQIFLWSAVFAAVDQKRIVGYSYEDFVAYYLLTMISRAFSSMPGLASQMGNQIRSGDIKKYLTQPVDMIGFFLLGRVAHKLAYYIVAIAPFALVFFLCRQYFPGWPSPSLLTAFGVSLVLSFLLGYFLEACMGLVGFWFLEVSSLLFVYMLLSFFLSGHMFPLDMLPGWTKSWGLLPAIPVQGIVESLPFAYLAYYPPAILLGKVPSWELPYVLATQVLWVAFFVFLSRLLYLRGLRHYGGYGG
jgi:viologen exporter family transport system permease protein